MADKSWKPEEDEPIPEYRPPVPESIHRPMGVLTVIGPDDLNREKRQLAAIIFSGVIVGKEPTDAAHDRIVSDVCDTVEAIFARFPNGG